MHCDRPQFSNFSAQFVIESSTKECSSEMEQRRGVIMRFAWLTNSMYDEEQNIAATGESPSTSKRYKRRTGNYFKFNCFNFLLVLQKTDFQLKLIACLNLLDSYLCCSTSLLTVFALFWFFFWWFHFTVTFLETTHFKKGLPLVTSQEYTQNCHWPNLGMKEVIIFSKWFILVNSRALHLWARV